MRARNKQWKLSLYIAGNTPKSNNAIINIKACAEEHLKGSYSMEIIDVLFDPELAMENQILAIPTLIKSGPGPFKRIVGDFTNKAKVLKGLGIENPS